MPRADTSTYAAAVPTSLVQPRRRWFYRGMAVVCLTLVFTAFAPGILRPTGRHAPLSSLVWIHAAVFMSWLCLFAVQTTLIARGRVTLHRSLGTAALALAGAVLATGYATAIAMGRRGFDLSGDLNAAADPLGALVFPLGDLASFTVLVAAGFWWRRRPAVHKRLMVLATAGSLMAAPLAHLIANLPTLGEVAEPIILIPLAVLYMASAVRDRVVDGRVHPISLWGGLALLAWAPIRAGVIGPSAAWHRFAGWLVS